MPVLSQPENVQLGDAGLLKLGACRTHVGPTWRDEGLTTAKGARRKKYPDPLYFAPTSYVGSPD